MRLARGFFAIPVFLCLSVAAEDTLVENWIAPPYWVSASRGAPSDTAAAPGARPGDTTGSASREALAVPTTPLPFVAIPPCRLADTRDGSFPVGYGPPLLSSGVARDFVFTGRCGIPASAEAVSANLTVTGALGPGFILNYPAGFPPIPAVSTLNVFRNRVKSLTA